MVDMLSQKMKTKSQDVARNVDFIKHPFLTHSMYQKANRVYLFAGDRFTHFDSYRLIYFLATK
jgi:hypothetical protein